MSKKRELIIMFVLTIVVCATTVASGILSSHAVLSKMPATEGEVLAEIASMQASLDQLHREVERLAQTQDVEEPEDDEETEEVEETKEEVKEPEVIEEVAAEDGNVLESEGEEVILGPVSPSDLKGKGPIYSFVKSFNDTVEREYMSNSITTISPIQASGKSDRKFFVEINNNISMEIVQDTESIKSIEIHAFDFVSHSEEIFLTETIWASIEALGKHSSEGCQEVLAALKIDGQILPYLGSYSASKDGVSYTMELTDEEAVVTITQ